MLSELLQTLLEWIQQHPGQAYIAVFFTAMLESLVLVGLILPGVVLMFGIGALVATGALDLTYTIIVAAAGAVAGDGVSFWLGRHYHQRLRVMWPLRRFPRLVNHGVDFFHRHGGKSVLFARFVGPVRPILPTVAGMLEMPPSRFFTVNVLSALVWAPAYLLPGMVFGASMGLAAEVAGRLAVLVLVLVALVWLAVGLTRQMLRLLQPRAANQMNQALEWSRNHPVIRPLAGSLLDPDHPEARGVATLAVLLGATALLFALTLGEVLRGALLSGLDNALWQQLQGLRTPLADQLMVLTTLGGDHRVLAGAISGGLLFLIARRHWKVAAHWLAAYAITLMLTHAIKFATAVPRPAWQDSFSTFAFPSAHASVSVAVYGFLAVVLARELRPHLRWIPYTLAAAIVIPVSFSRLYLGAHWFSDVFGGITLGTAWVALLGIAYRRHPAEKLSPSALLAATMIGATLTLAWNAGTSYTALLARYQSPVQASTFDASSWWQHGWRDLPAYRIDLRDTQRHVMNVQFAGNIGSFTQLLLASGWHAPTKANATNMIRFLAPNIAASEIPVLPQVHDGRYEQLRLIHPYADGSELLVLRLWQAHADFGAPEKRIWLGSIAPVYPRTLAGMITYLRTRESTPDDLARIPVAWNQSVEWKLGQRDGGQAILLVRIPE